MSKIGDIIRILPQCVEQIYRSDNGEIPNLKAHIKKPFVIVELLILDNSNKYDYTVSAKSISGGFCIGLYLLEYEIDIIATRKEKIKRLCSK